MRAFLTLVPDTQTALAIERWCELCWPVSGRKVPVQNYHMTLAFLGEVDDAALQQLSEMLEGFSHSIFQVSLNQIGYWSNTEVLYLGTNSPPKELLALHDKCRQIANRISARGGSSRYEPHITLARKLNTPPLPALLEPDFTFTAETLELWSSVRESYGARYSTVGSWGLT